MPPVCPAALQAAEQAAVRSMHSTQTTKLPMEIPTTPSPEHGDHT
ncbi:hypothetical protein [Streptomyces sp. MUM 178J]|nr:hypothetical protein [Streptomyces sp. MUM 178J]WRQ79235.1 hypothetical protein I3F59_007545 [Streptomyces sp. MUM 178J]